MKRISSFLVALLLLAAPVSLYAKKDAIVAIPASDTLREAVSFNTVKVIDLRSDKSNIGKLTGSMGKKLINTSDSLSITLRRLVQSMLIGTANMASRELLIVVHDLRLTDYLMEQQRISTVLLDIDFYLGNNGLYTPVGHLDSLYEMQKGKRALEFAGLVAGYLITKEIMEIAALQTLPETQAQTLTAILSAKEEARRNIFRDTQPTKTGVYYTYEQFRNNTPAETNIHHERYFAGDAHVDRFFLSSAEKKKEKDLAYSGCFAIYFEGKWYKRYTENTFREMKVVDGDFYYYDISKGLRLDDYSSVAAVGVPFGIMGALASTAIALALNEGQNGKPPVYQDALFRMKLDPETGMGKKLERIR